MTLYYAAWAVTLTFVGTLVLLTVVVILDRLLIAHRYRAAARRIAAVYADHTDPAWDRLAAAVEQAREDIDGDWRAWEREVAL